MIGSLTSNIIRTLQEPFPVASVEKIFMALAEGGHWIADTEDDRALKVVEGADNKRQTKRMRLFNTVAERQNKQRDGHPESTLSC
ncbi:hypothetical protein ACIBQ1_26045 [Nonomuraea sp. NPDC050153]|uniref:hypothetical protein n=1 Tax=Nonomuraea sp. NPDC050153 TaxID=3364359 RepID=UPI0037B93001